MNTLRDKVITILVSKFTVNPDVLAEDPTLDEIGFDSLAIVEFATAIEKEYGTPVDEEELKW